MDEREITAHNIEAFKQLKELRDLPEMKALPVIRKNGKALPTYAMNRHQRRGLEKLKRKEADLRKRLAALDQKLR